MTSITKMKIRIVLVGALLLFVADSLWACHQFEYGKTGMLEGHTSTKVKSNWPRPQSGFGMTTTRPTTSTTDGVIASIYGTSDSTATMTDCNWRTASIQKFFNDSYEQIAEESAQGSGKYLEALASLTGCSAEQYGTFETVMNRNHRYVFADKGYDGSISNFFTVLNTDEDLKQCFGQQSPG